jgi:NAD(P)-dependent dehydrogenase (short-subunit alcohol dehydrogenase family)
LKKLKKNQAVMNKQSSDLLARYVIKAQERALAPVIQGRLNNLFLITEDPLGVANALADLLIYQGAFAYIIEREKCGSEAAVCAEAKQARNLFGPVNGMIHLAGLSAEPMPADIASWRKQVELQCKSLFWLLQCCHQDLENHSGTDFIKIITCSLLGGFYGRDGCPQSGLPIAGAGQGLLRSLGYEWDCIWAKSVDFGLDLSAAEMAENLVNELLIAGDGQEIGYPGGKRTIFYTMRHSLKPHIKPAGLIPKKDWLILATGGARGITARAIQMLANDNNHFILIGKGKLADRSEYQKYLKFDKEALRAEFIAQARTSREKITPGMIEAKVTGILHDREIRKNIAILRRTGNKVSYLSCDVADPAAFGEAIDSIYRTYGKIDIVIHGAGIIDDHLLANKSAESFNRVFDTKVDSAYTLYSKLKWELMEGIFFFSSTAGRYGNRGQSDYAAANEVLNRLAWRIRSKWPHVLVKAFNWGPWSGVGMASNAVNSQFISRDIYPISAENGQRYFLGEMMHGDPAEVEVIMGEGTWDPEREDSIRDVFNAGLHI